MREGSFHSLGSTLKLLALPSFNSVSKCYVIGATGLISIIIILVKLLHFSFFLYFF